MLTAAEVLQVARERAPDATVTNRSTQAEVDLPDGGAKVKPARSLAGRQQYGEAVVTRRTTIDRPAVEVAFPGGLRVELGLVRPGQPDARWLAVTYDGDRRLGTVELRGTGDVARQVAIARELAGLPEPARPPQPSHLASLAGDVGVRDTAASPPGGRS
jgi:hypothetical protein